MTARTNNLGFFTRYPPTVSSFSTNRTSVGGMIQFSATFPLFTFSNLSVHAISPPKANPSRLPTCRAVSIPPCEKAAPSNASIVSPNAFPPTERVMLSLSSENRPSFLSTTFFELSASTFGGGSQPESLNLSESENRSSPILRAVLRR